jgi:hypothetical protein
MWDPRPIFLSPWDFLLDSYCLLLYSALFDTSNNYLNTGVGVLLATDSQSTSSSGYRASLWDPWPDFILFFFFVWQLLYSSATSLSYRALGRIKQKAPLAPLLRVVASVNPFASLPSNDCLHNTQHGRPWVTMATRHKNILEIKAISVTGLGDLLGCEMLRTPHCIDRLTDGGKVVSPTHHPHFTPQKHYFFF